MMRKIDYILLLIIFILALSLRTYNINWDSGFHMHPDERAITLYLMPLHLPSTFSDFFSVQSPLNPHFFAYGSFPLYMLKALSIPAGYLDRLFSTYERINILGRFLSAVFDTATAGIVFLIGRKLFNKKTGIIAAACYAISVLPIQLSHFFAVDTFVTFFTTLCVYQLLIHYQNPSFKKAFFVGLFLGLGLATKNSALALLAAIGLALIADFLLIFLKQPHKPHIWFPHVSKIIKILLTEGLIIMITAIATFAVCEPYALIDFHTFWQQTLEQSKMTRDAFTFPYTFQFIGKIPFFYELKNIFLWGQGPFLALFSLSGALYFTLLAITKNKHAFFLYSLDEQPKNSHHTRIFNPWAQELIVATFFWSYFFVVGKFAIGFMRYMLPVYPLLSLFAAVMIYKTSSYLHYKLKRYYFHTSFYILLTSILLIWPLSFIHIYTKTNTRILATEWINQSIPPGKTLAVEHWDDGLPLIGQEKYHMITYPLYDADTPQKWGAMDANIAQTDYIILASDRLYGALMKLTDCQKLPAFHCYPQSAQYYTNLFSGNPILQNVISSQVNTTTRFAKVAEFAVYPTIPFLNIPIDDQSADESFTVFDHPKVQIFEKNGMAY